jgi:N-acetylmuramoyl-L-alanine amidase
MTTTSPSARRVVPSRMLSALRRWRALAIPLALAAVATASASGMTLIRIQPGDTLSAIALRYHTTVARLVAINHLPGDGDLIYAGAELKVPTGARSHGGGHGTRQATRMGTIYHTVVTGDTLYGIAARYHVAPMTIARRNHLPASLVVVLGQRLAIPHRITVHHHHHHHHRSRANGFTSAAERERVRLEHRYEPSQTQVEAMIRSEANRWNLDPRLALAVSWQESGWNMRAVSPVGAIGAMQVMPYTGTYLADNVLHRHLDLGDAHDNISAGVALLSILTHEARSTAQAVAGYYQGLDSVRTHGMLPSTKHYVADVLALRNRF